MRATVYIQYAKATERRHGAPHPPRRRRLRRGALARLLRRQTRGGGLSGRPSGDVGDR